MEIIWMEIFDFSQYSFVVAIVQIFVAGIIFYITNWLGGHTPIDKGYVTLSLIVEDDTMPAFNFVFKTLTPLVLYLLFLALFQYFKGLSVLIANSYLIIAYYWLYRLAYYIIHNVLGLINWVVFGMYVIVTLGISIWLYSIVETVDSIFPSIESLRDQLWILIAIFIYQILNKLEMNRKDSEKRKEKYIFSRYKQFKIKYGRIVSANSECLVDECLIYAIMIVENYNRSPFIRQIEKIKFLLTKKKMSLGIMQVKTVSMITNEQSVEIASKMIVSYRKIICKEEDGYDFYPSWSARKVANKYNGGNDKYNDEVGAIFEQIIVHYVPNISNMSVKEAISIKLDFENNESK